MKNSSGFSKETVSLRSDSYELPDLVAKATTYRISERNGGAGQEDLSSTFTGGLDELATWSAEIAATSSRKALFIFCVERVDCLGIHMVDVVLGV